MAVISSIKIDTTSANKSINELEKSLQETNEQLKLVSINSDAFKELQSKAATIKGLLDEINQQTDTLSKGFQGFGDNLGKVTSGITGGITAATAAMQLLGVENDDVLAGIAKLQQLMAFSQGIASLKDMATAMKALNIATKGLAGPLGLAAAAVSALILIWNKWGDQIRQQFPLIDKIATSIEKLKDKIMGVNDAVKSTLTSTDELSKIESELQQLQLDKQLKLLNSEAKQTYDIYQSELKRLDLEKQKYSILMKNSKSLKEFETYRAEGLKVLEQESQLQQKITDLFNDRKSYAESIEQTDLSTLSSFSGVDLFSNTKSDKDTKSIEKPDPEREEETDDGWADKIQAAQEYYNSITTLQYSEYETFKQIQADKLSQLQSYLDEGLISEQQYSDAVEQLAKEEKLTKISLYSLAATGIADILNNLAGTMDETNEKQFEAMKAMQISAATIQMMVGITTALSGAFTTKTGPWDIALAVIQASSIAASGAAQIAQIARQQYNSESSSSSTVTATSGLSSTASSITSPEQYSLAVDNANIESVIGDTRVYVVESDIQSTRNKVSVQESENRY